MCFNRMIWWLHSLQASLLNLLVSRRDRTAMDISGGYLQQWLLDSEIEKHYVSAPRKKYVMKCSYWCSKLPWARWTSAQGPEPSRAATENCCPPVRIWKNHCLCICECHLSTNLILSALHLYGLKSNTYVHFHWANRQLTGISISKWPINNVINLEVKNIAKPSLALRL